MSDEAARLQQFIEAQRVGLLKVVEGVFTAIRARLPEPEHAEHPTILRMDLEDFDGLWCGTRTADVRAESPDFRVGDMVEYLEWRPRSYQHTGRWIHARILRVDRLHGLCRDCVLLSLMALRRGEAPNTGDEHAVAAQMAAERVRIRED